MIARLGGLTVLLALWGAGMQGTDWNAVVPSTDPVLFTANQVALTCTRVNIYWGDKGLMPLEDRLSPYDSTLIAIGEDRAKVCYGRPSMRDRVIFGGLVPLDTLWRTGANEPTTIHLPFAASIAGLAVQPGAYTLYTVPRRGEWTVIVNRSTSQWGEETQYTPEVRAQEVGRASVRADTTDASLEMFTISSQPVDQSSANLILQWENRRVTIPIRKI